MIPGIITLVVVGVVIFIASFFFTDGKKEEGTDLAAESREDLEKKLDEYCDLLVEKKKNELKKQGEEVKANMKKGLEEVKSSSKKELEEIRENAKKEIDDIRVSTQKRIEDLQKDVDQKAQTSLKEYEADIEKARNKMQTEIEACSSQLSEKAKKQMIDYINQSLTEAYEAYDPDDKSEKAPITYDEETEAERAPEETSETDSNVADVQEKEKPDQQVEENTDENKAESKAVDNEPAADVKPDTDGAADEDTHEATVSVEEAPVTDSAFTVVESDNPEKTAADIEDKTETPAAEVPARNRNNRSRKKKKKKNSQSKPIEIWDESEDVESQVADLHKKGLSIMEIANKLGIGVGEAKIIIDKINETDKQ